jgi:hypothetical protein
MNKNKYLHDNHEVNLILKGFTSILVGFYLFFGAYVIKSVLDGFLIDDNLVGMFSVEIIEFISIGILFLVFLFSSLALIFAGKRIAKRHQFKLWNAKTKKTSLQYLAGTSTLFTVVILFMNEGLIDAITPAILITYGLLLFIVKNKDRKQLLILSGLSFGLGFLCLVFPGYWSSALSILGIAHAAYGIIVN